MKILVIDNATKHLDELKAWLTNMITTAEITVRGFGEVSVDDCASFDLVVLSGGSMLSVAGHEKEYAREIDVVLHAEKPILGICLGFELIAAAYGGTLFKMGEKRRGEIEISLVQGDPLTAGIDSLRVHEAHCWVVTDAGTKLKVLGRSQDGIEIIRHATKPIFGFQFHPEFTARDATTRLLDRLLWIIGAAG
jgi:GMP synthase-like glutamine amidotransferase